MRFDFLTLFPNIVDEYMRTSVLGRGQGSGVIESLAHDLRAFATDAHRTVDDTPYGGGAGMVLRVEPIALALESIATQSGPVTAEKKRIVVLSAKGQQFTQAKAHEYADLEQLVLICGRFEGIDQRVIDHLADEEVSVGPYVLAGGELAALAVAEATARLVPGVLGNQESLSVESHVKPGQTEAPQYTKPAEYQGWEVPEVLLSGNHAEIEKWRRHNSI